MIILPAIDLLDGRCVRLRQGDYGTAGVMADDVLAAARAFEDDGASWLHVVDLDGARQGQRVNSATVLDVAEQTGLSVEVGGGIRTARDIEYYLSRGVSRVILGSVALSDEGFTAAAAAEYGEGIAVGIDARDGFARASGWLEGSDMHYLELARRMEQAGVKTIIYTDISRDGMLSGLNMEQLRALAGSVSCRIIASGGVAGPQDVRACADAGLYGVICGRALYNGALSLKDALGIARGEERA